MRGSDLSDDHLEAWRALLRAQAFVLRRISEELARGDALPLESYDVLLELYRAPEKRLRLRDLGERVVLTRSGISRLVTRLEKQGLVERGAVPSDARGVFAQLTPKGEAAFRRTWPAYAEGIRRHFAERFEAEEARTLSRLLGAVLVEDE